jgi:L-gulono-1,4-lactone dehydrogenase
MAKRDVWTTEDFKALLQGLEGASLTDPRWEELADGLTNPSFTEQARAVLDAIAREGDLSRFDFDGPKADDFTAQGLDELRPSAPRGTSNYLGEQVHAEPPVAYRKGFDVGPWKGTIEHHVRAFGAGHSSSGAPHGVIGGTLLGTRIGQGSEVLLPFSDGTLRDGVEPEGLVRVRASATLTELNKALETKGKALANLTGYSGLTVGGVLSTAAHGSGASLGPLCDLVVSVTLRDAARRLHRVELAGAELTDAERWGNKHKGGLVFTDPDTFYSVVVGIGCMGVLEDVVLRVRPRYLLTEVRERSTWDKVRESLRAGEYNQSRHYEVLVCPYKKDKEVPCAVLTRREATAGPTHGLPPLRKRSQLTEELFRLLGAFLRLGLTYVRGAAPALVQKLVEQYATLPEEAAHESPAGSDDPVKPGTYGGWSFDVLDIGSANQVKGVATEIAFVMPGGNADDLIAAVDALLARAEEQRNRNGWVHTLPVSLRFCKASPHYLAMQHGAPDDVVCCVEMLALHGVKQGEEALKAFQRDAPRWGGRAHWGQRNDEMPAVTNDLYPKLDAWMATRARFDPEGRFANEMTQRLGLTPKVKLDDLSGSSFGDARALGVLNDLVGLVRGRPPTTEPPRQEIPYNEQDAKTDQITFAIADVSATRFAEAFLKAKSRQANFGPFQLKRDPEGTTEDFRVDDRFEGRLQVEKVWSAYLERHGVPPLVRRLMEAIVGSSIPTCYYQIKELDLVATSVKPARGRYVLLNGSPIAGHIEFTAVDVPGGCDVTQTLKYVPQGWGAAEMMKHVGKRLTRVVAYCEVEMTAKQLGVDMLSREPPPTLDEALRAPPPSGEVIATDAQGIVAIKHDVRRFRVQVEAKRFVEKFHELLSNPTSFDFFRIERESYAQPFAVGDTFAGVFTLTPALRREIRSLRPPQGKWEVPTEVFKQIVERALRDEPPKDYGKVTALQIDRAPFSVRYDYTEGSPIAGHSTFTVEDLPGNGSVGGACLVTQRFVYQEQRLLDVELFGTIGLFLHNRVVEEEIKATAAALGCGWTSIDD